MHTISLKKETFKEARCRELLALLGIFLIGVVSTQCSTDLEQRRTKVHKKALESAQTSAHRSFKARDDFLVCVEEYARRNARLSATATEIAEAATSACQGDLGFYRFYRKGYYGSMGLASEVADSYRSREGEEEKARLDTMDLIEEGKRLVIKTLIEMR